MSSKKKSSSHDLGKRLIGLFLSAATVVTTFAGLTVFGSAAVAPQVFAAEAVADYGLMDSVQEGVILHAWDWSFNTIKANMAAIAEAGYTSIQTSPIQQAKEGTAGKTNSVWWVFYQPANFTIDNTGNSALGTKAEFEAMCEEAHKYGIHVIVDVVANHLGNETGYDKSSAIPSDIRNDSTCWHTYWNVEHNSSDRNHITNYSLGGLPDLNTESTKIQNYVITYLKECIDAGADGFRFDAAKHIGTLTDGASYTFWENVIPEAKEYYQQKGTFRSGLYCYGEILGSTGGSTINDTTNSYLEHIKLTDDSSGNDIRKAIVNKSASGAADSYYDKNATADNLVLWAESHDTYSGDSQQSTSVSETNINKTWAIVASRSKATALYYARSTGYRTGTLGAVGSTACFSNEVAQVNKFHNYFNGKSEYLSYNGNIVYNERGTEGVVLVNASGTNATVSVPAHRIADGSYTDQITGNKFTVSGGTIKGTIGTKGIAVVYNPDNGSGFRASPAGVRFDDTLDVTLRANNITDARYFTSEGESGSFENSTTITIGNVVTKGTVILVTVVGKDANSQTIHREFTYYKNDSTETQMVYFDNSTYNWTNVYAYIYSGSNKNGTWPGVKMTRNAATGLYELPVSATLAGGRVIFTESKSATTNRYPADGQMGLKLEGTTRVFMEAENFNDYVPESQELYNSSCLQESGPISLGDSAIVVCAGDGGYGSRQYALYYRLDGGEETLYADYANVSFITFTPEEAGSYTLISKSRDSHNQPASHSFDLQVNTLPLENNTSFSYGTGQLHIGDKVNVTFAASGGAGGNTFALEYKHSTDSAWQTARDFGTGTSAEFTLIKGGKYSFRSTVKDKKGNRTYSYCNVSALSNDLSNTTYTDSEQVVVNESLILHGAATGGYLNNGSSYKFAFQVKNSSGSWKTLRDFNTSSDYSCTFTEPGKYSLRSIAKDDSGAVAYAYHKAVVVPPALTNLSSLSQSEITIGSGAVINLAAEGGWITGTGYRFAVDYKLAGRDTDWVSHSALSAAASSTFTPDAIGSYTLRVTARDDYPQQKYLYLKLNVVPEPLENTSALSSDTVSVGTEVTINCSASKGWGSYKFAVKYKNKGDTSWRQYKDFSADTSVSFTPDTIGTCAICVTAKDAKNKTANTYLILKVTALPLQNTSTISDTTGITVGDPVTLTLSGKDGNVPEGGYSFSVWYKMYDNDSWIELQSNSRNASLVFTPERAGSCSIRTAVIDLDRKAAYSYFNFKVAAQR